MAPRGYRFCSIAMAREHVAAALLVLERYPFLCSIREMSGGVSYTMDLSGLPSGDGPAAELMIRRDVERHR